MSSTSKPFTQEIWERKQVNFLAQSNLPFKILAHKDLNDLIQTARLAPSRPELLSPLTARRRLQRMAKEDQERVLLGLPPNAKLSIALDCWTSPFQQAFIAITGYFLDREWNYREVLLGFEPIHGTHSGANLSLVLLERLEQHGIVDRVLAVTTDNASNNNTLIESIQQSIQSLELPNQTPIVRIPCLAHVIQLSLRDLLGLMRVDPKNDTTDRQWSEDYSQSLQKNQRQQGIIYTLSKVRYLLYISTLDSLGI